MRLSHETIRIVPCVTSYMKLIKGMAMYIEHEKIYKLSYNDVTLTKH